MEALLTHGEGLLVPERMIIAPSVGVFRPLDDVDAGDARRRGPDRRSPRRSRHVDARVQPVPRPARGHARPPRRAPPRGPARRLAASRLSMRAAIAGWGTALPEQRLTNAELEQRVDTTDQWIVERTGIRERRVARRRRDHRDASPSTRGAAAIKHAGPHARRHRPARSSPPRTPEQPIPHTGAFVGDGLGLRCGSFDLNAGCAGFVYELVVGAVDAHRRRPRARARRSAPRRCSRVIDPHRPRHLHPLR